MRTREFERYYERYRHVMVGMARKLVGRDDALVEDLTQEAAFALFQLKPERATSNPDAWIRQALRNRMVDYLRRVNPRKYESLDERLESGDQLERLPDGTLNLITERDNLTPASLQDEADEAPAAPEDLDSPRKVPTPGLEDLEVTDE